MTATETYCVHMDVYIVPGTCAMCDPPRPEPSRYGDHGVRRVTARYPGVCEICDEHIDPGQEIASVEEGHWAHYGCIDRETADEEWWEQ